MDLVLALTWAAVLVAVGVWAIVVRLHRHSGRPEPGAFVLLAFVLAYPTSALAHFVDPAGDPRGFADLVREDRFDPSALWFGLLLVTLAEVALLLGLGMKPPDGERPLLWRRPIFLVWGLVFGVLGLYGTLRVFGGEADILSALSTIDRERAFDAGEARYYFISRWFGWGVTFIILWAVTRPRAGTRLIWITLIGGTAVIVGSLFWRGGRTEAMLAVVPLWLLVARAGVLKSRTLMPLLVTAGFAYVLAISVLRTAEDHSLKQTTLEMVDWHAGRFSMIGPCLRIRDEVGLLWGETLLAGPVEALNAPFVFAGVGPAIPMPRRITSFFGAALRQDESVNSIVPGVLSELLLNFGVGGVILGFMAIGYGGRRLAHAVGSTDRPAAACACLYGSILLATGVVPGTATGWLYVFATFGLPVICVTLHEAAVWPRRTGRSAPSHGPGLRPSRSPWPAGPRSPTPRPGAATLRRYWARSATAIWEAM